MLSVNDLNFSNQKFWISFFATSFPTSLEKDTDNAAQIISDYLKDIFEVRLCNLFANSIVYGLTEE